jgi:DNA-binding transcriptional MerR regulator
MRTAKVAMELDVSADLIRRIEAKGEIPRVARSRSGQRHFSTTDVERLRRLLYPEGADLRATLDAEK